MDMRIRIYELEKTALPGKLPRSVMIEDSVTKAKSYDAGRRKLRERLEAEGRLVRLRSISFTQEAKNTVGLAAVLMAQGG